MVCLHTGASGWAPLPSPDPPFELFPTLFPVNALLAAAEWLWSGVPLRFPDLAVAMSEGGIGWVPMLHRPGRLRARALGLGHREHRPGRRSCAPARCCAATSGSAPSTTRRSIELRHRIGVDHIMVESDYPARRLHLARHPGRAGEDARAPPRRRAAHDRRRATPPRLFRHPLPPADDWRT